jgi:hypothetical protein
MALKALVTVVAMVDGMRVEFEPGSELPALHPHDVVALKEMGAVEDSVDSEAAEKRSDAALKAAAKDFDAERKAVTAAKKSSAAPAKQ